MTPDNTQGSDTCSEEGTGTGIVELTRGPNRPSESPRTAADSVSNTETPFGEEDTEGSDIPPRGSGDLREKKE
jgi:hypothetical protein